MGERTVQSEDLVLDLRAPAATSVADLRRIVGEARKQRESCATPISSDSVRMLRELFGIVGVKYSEDDFSDFSNARTFTLVDNYKGLPKISNAVVKDLKKFKEFGIKIDENNIQKLARGEGYLIQGAFEQAPKEEQFPKLREWIKKLEKYNIYVGIYEDGSVYTANRAGYLIQKLTNAGVNVDLQQNGLIVLTNDLYAPRNIPKEVLDRLDSALQIARALSDQSKSVEALRICKIALGIITIYRTAERFQHIADDASNYTSVKLSNNEWEWIKGKFDEDRFKTITGATYQSFEKLSLSIGELAKGNAIKAAEMTIDSVNPYLDLLKKTATGSDTSKPLQDLEDKQENIFYNASICAERTNRIILMISSSSDIRTNVLRSKVEMENKLQDVVAYPDIERGLNGILATGLEELDAVETQMKYFAFYALANLNLTVRGDEAGLKKLDEEVKKLEVEKSRYEAILKEKFEKARENFYNSLEAKLGQMDFRGKISIFQERLELMRMALEDNSPLSDVEKDLIRHSFERHVPGITFKKAAEILEELYEKGRVMDLIREGECVLDEKKRYSMILAAINFAYPFTWRLRMQRLESDIEAQTINSELSAGVSPWKPFTNIVVNPRDIITDEKRRELLKKDIPRLEKYFAQKWSEIIDDAYIASERLKMLMPPERKKQLETVSAAGTAYAKVERINKNATAVMEDKLKELEQETGDLEKLNYIQRGQYLRNFMSVYLRTCDQMAEKFEDMAFDEAIAALPWHRQFLSESARFLDKNADTIMWIAAAIGAIAGVFDSGGLASEPEALAAREGASILMRSFVKRYGINIARKMIGNYALANRALALSSVATSGLMFAFTKNVDKDKREFEREIAYHLFERSIVFGIQGSFMSRPGWVSPTFYSRLGIATNILVVGGTAIKVAYKLHEMNKQDTSNLSQAKRFQRDLEKVSIYLDVGLVLLPSLIPGITMTKGFVQGARGFTRVGLSRTAALAGTARAGLRGMSIDLRKLYGKAAPAFHSGDIVLAVSMGAIIPATYSFGVDEKSMRRKSKALMNEKEREQQEMIPVKITPDILGKLPESKLKYAIGPQPDLLSIDAYCIKRPVRVGK